MKTTSAPSKANLEKAFQLLSEQYPNARTELTYETPFQLLIAVILSAQCTDVRVNMTTPALFAEYPDAAALGAAKPAEIEKLVKSCGFYRMKAKAIIEASRDIEDKFGGEIPNTLDQLITLRGVGRKTASVVLSQAFDVPAIAVDTHVNRVANRLGWANHADPVKIEFELRSLLPIDRWSSVNTLLILHGRRICKARKPLCTECFLNDQCRFFLGGGEVKTTKKGAAASGKSSRPSPTLKKGSRSK